MKIAIAFVFLALVCSSQAQLSFLDSAKDSITNLSKAATDNINQAKENLQAALGKGTQQITGATQNLVNVAEKVVKGLEKVTDSIVKTTEDNLNKLTEEAEADGIDVSECKALTNTLRVTAGNTLKDAFSCVTTKIDEAKSITTNVLTLGKETLTEITGIKGKIEDCVKDAEGITGKIAAAACLTSVGTKSTVALTTKVPAVAKNVADATKLVSTLQTSLTTCASTKAIGALAKKASAVIADTKDCIAEKTGNQKNQSKDQTAKKNQKEEQTAEKNQKEEQTAEKKENGIIDNILNNNNIGSLVGKLFG